MAMLSSRGALRPRTALLVLWGVLTGAAAAILLLVGGNDALQSLQQAAIVAAAPFLIVMMGICWSILKELRAEAPAVAPEPERAAIRLPGTPAPQQTSPIDPESRS
jgi:choline-glycine betaine transporter